MTAQNTVLGRLGADERGAAALTLIMMMPIWLMLLRFAVFAGRMVNTQQEVVSAARDGSRWDIGTRGMGCVAWALGRSGLWELDG
ncbi:MAG: pilus assembly protein [Actinomycetia bacterium]|nr:pilus assembly protein [Actinomycetes bacterium]